MNSVISRTNCGPTCAQYMDPFYIGRRENRRSYIDCGKKSSAETILCGHRCSLFFKYSYSYRTKIFGMTEAVRITYLQFLPRVRTRMHKG